MSEFENVIPSDAELRAYLEKHRKDWSFSMLLRFPENRGNYHPEVAEALEFLSARPICADFLESADSTIFQALKRLNQLPRSDLFWANTNCRPTIFKLSEYGIRIIKENPDDVLSLRTRAILEVASVGEFRPQSWIQLFQLGAVQLEFVAFAAMLLEVAGAPDADQFAFFVLHTRTAVDAAVLLQFVARAGGTILAEWSGRTTSLLNGHRSDLQPQN